MQFRPSRAWCAPSIRSTLRAALRSATCAALCSVISAAPALAVDDEAELPAELSAYCDHVAACDTSGATTADDCVADAPNLEIIDGVDHDQCRALLEAMLARYACHATLPCEEIDDSESASCATESNAVLDEIYGGADACFSGHEPVDVPDTWTCAVFYYSGGVDDGCDCGCGAIDPDCGDEGGCAESGCFEEMCEYCYVGGEDVGCTDPAEGEGEGSGLPLPQPTPTPEPGPASCAGVSAASSGPLALAFALAFPFAQRALRSRRRTPIAGEEAAP